MTSGTGWRLAGRARARSRWLLVAAVVAALPVAAVLAVLGAPAWAQIGALTAGALIGVAVSEARARRSERDAAAGAVRGSVAGAAEEWPLVAEVGALTARVHPATHETAYVAREAEADVTEALRDRGRVLVAGAPMCGKTRLALHAVQDAFAGHRLLSPRTGTALHDLGAGEVKPQDVVVWLDDLERFLGPGGLTAEDLESFCLPGTVAVATIGAGFYQDLLPRDGLKPAGWDVLGWFGNPVWLSWSPAETTRAAASVAPGLADGVRRYGLSAYLAAGPVAVSHFRAAEHDRPVGHALVRAAADWRRGGAGGPVPREVLAALLPAYADPSGDAPAVQEALDWATRPVDRTVALLTEEAGGYDVLDYVVAEVDAEGRPIPDLLWEVAAQRSAGDSANLGFGAVTRHDRPEAATRLWDRSDDPAVQYNLGLLRFRGGDDSGRRAAESHWRTAAQAGDPASMYSLGVLLGDSEDPTRREEGEEWSRAAARASGRRRFGVLREPGSPLESTVVFTGSVTEEEQATLTRELLGYRRFLDHHQLPQGGVPTVHVDPTAAVAYPEPARNRLFLGRTFVDSPGTLLHEYTHWLLEEVLGVARELWTPDVRALESGLAYYLPCSHADYPREVPFVDVSDGTAAWADALDPAHRTGLRWASVLWRLREATPTDPLDTRVLGLWRQVAPRRDDRAALAGRLRASLPAGDGAAYEAAVDHALAASGLNG